MQKALSDVYKRQTQDTAAVTAAPFAGAALTGYQIHTGRTEVQGVPFCTLADEMCIRDSLYALLAPMLERETGLPVLGYLPHLPDAALESRHLGLKTAGEIADLQQKISRMADALVMNWEKLSILTEGAAPLVHTDRLPPAGELPPQGAEEQRPRVPIAVARDAAFCFTYAETCLLYTSSTMCPGR